MGSGTGGNVSTYPGVYRGVCTLNDDPEHLLRIKVRVPQVLGNAETNWAWPVVPNVVGVTPPGVGDPVWVAFEAGDVEQPVWLGTWRPSRELSSGGPNQSFVLSGGTNTHATVMTPVWASMVEGEAQPRVVATSRGLLFGGGSVPPSNELYWNGEEIRTNVGLSDEGGELAHEALYWMEV